nr:hypothetical protein [Tanacetum cinerariifolium]
MIGSKVTRTLTSVEIEIMLILRLSCCLSSSSSVRCLESPDEAQSSRVPVPLPKDPYEAIRQAYLVGMDTESEPFEVKARTPKSPYIVALPTCHVEESESSGTSGARSTSSDSNESLSPDHPLTHTTPALVPILRRTARMAVRVSPAMSPGLSASIAEVAVMSDLAFRKRFRSSYDSSPSPTLSVQKRDEGLAVGVEGPSVDDESYGLDDESYGLDDKIHGVDDESCVLDNEGRGVEIDGLCLEEEEEAIPMGQQQATPVVRTAVSAPLGVGYGALRRQELALEGDHVYSTFEVGQSSGSAPEPERSERVAASRQPTLTTWIDPEDGMVYIDIPVYPTPAPPV